VEAITWTDDLTAQTVSGGHFNPEEAPDELAEILASFSTNVNGDDEFR
jgi:hypothetical protein